MPATPKKRLFSDDSPQIPWLETLEVVSDCPSACPAITAIRRFEDRAQPTNEEEWIADLKAVNSIVGQSSREKLELVAIAGGIWKEALEVHRGSRDIKAWVKSIGPPSYETVHRWIIVHDLFAKYPELRRLTHVSYYELAGHAKEVASYLESDPEAKARWA